jgi:secreted PhoX family phosphatase
MKTVYFFLAFILIWCKLHAQVITTIAGTGISGFSGEGGIATNAQFSFPDGITADKWGNVYIADRINSVVQKIDTNGILSRFAGNGLYGYTGDGAAATNARLSMYTAGMVTDTIGNLFISCNGTVRKVNALGIISTVAGNNNYGYSGDGGPATAAEFKTTTGICFDNAGNLYIADDQAYVIRMVNSAGIISTFAGTGTLGFSGDGGPATAAQLKTPAGITFDDSGNLYIADRSNQRIRKVNTSGIITSVAGGNPMVMPCCYWGCPATSLNIAP